MLRDKEDGALDVSDWLASGQGFLPIVLPITDPAVGTGLAGGVLYFHRQDEGAEGAPLAPPSISFAGGAATDNGTRAIAAGHMGIWNQGKTRYIGALFAADANLTLYGTGEGLLPAEVAWNIKLAGTVQQLKFEIAKHLMLGVQYLFLNTKSRFKNGEEPLGPEAESDLGGFGPTIAYDGRNTIFTPTSGLYAGATLLFHDEVFGSDFDYPRLNLESYKYWDMEPFVLGLRFSGAATGGGAPIYGLPFLRMRGVPAFRYVGQYTALGEVEPVWKVNRRWSLLGFLSAGQAVLDVSEFGDVDTIVAGGVGVRYTLARKQGLGVGIDVAQGPEDTVVYFSLGSYWRGL